MIEEKKTPKPKIQNLILENREKLNISGVIDVESFNDECVIVDTELGRITSYNVCYTKLLRVNRQGANLE